MSRSHHPMRLLLTALTALVLLAGTALATAIVPANKTFSFVGACTDCSGSVTATLVVNGAYTQGNPLATSDLVSFTYGGSNLLPLFTITNTSVTTMSGLIPTGLPSFADFYITDAAIATPTFQTFTLLSVIDAPTTHFFESTAAGTWRAGLGSGVAINLDQYDSDNGTAGTWGTPNNAVPEPGAFALVAGGLAVLGLRRWRRQ